MNRAYDGSRWYVVTLALFPDAVEEMAEWIRAAIGVEPVALEKPGTEWVWLESYFESPEAAECAMKAVRESGRCAQAMAIRRCDARDWHAFWQSHFRARPIGRRLYLCPAWQEPEPHDTLRVTLRMTPGLSFGTGEHFTTRFCLEMIDRLAPPAGPCRSLWDAGCGSGILAVAGAMLGMAPVLGTDNDPACLEQARENACLNHVSHINWMISDLCGAPDEAVAQRYHLVCANLYAGLLQRGAERLWGGTSRYLALSGIREQELDGVAEAYAALGARKIVRDGDGEWAGLLFDRESC